MAGLPHCALRQDAIHIPGTQVATVVTLLYGALELTLAQLQMQMVAQALAVFA